MLFNPLIQSIAIPFGLTLVVAGLLRLIFGKERGGVLACFAVAVGFLASYLATLGTPPFPPRSSMQKFPYLVLAGAALGLALDLARAERTAKAAAVLYSTAGLIWLAWPLFSQFSVASGIAFAALAVCGGFITACFPVEDDRSLDGAVILLAVSLGLGAIAMLFASASIGQIAFALAAALGGFMLWNWPFPRFRFALAGLLPAAGALIFLCFILGFTTKASPLALALLAPALASGAALAGITGASRKLSQMLVPVIIVIIAAIPVAAAIAIAYQSAPPSGGY